MTFTGRTYRDVRWDGHRSSFFFFFCQAVPAPPFIYRTNLTIRLVLYWHWSLPEKFVFVCVEPVTEPGSPSLSLLFCIPAQLFLLSVWWCILLNYTLCSALSWVVQYCAMTCFCLIMYRHKRQDFCIRKHCAFNSIGNRNRSTTNV